MGNLPSLALPFWNFFRHTVDAGVWCAVPESCPVPSFLRSGDWRHVIGGCSVHVMAPIASKAVAHEGVRLNGFYLFHRFGP